MIVGDSNMSEYAAFLKVGACGLLLRMLEEPNVVFRDMTLENPIRAIREISNDLTCRRPVRLASGREMSALDIQREFLDRALRFGQHREMSVEEQQVLSMWEHCLDGIEKDPLCLNRECDWVAKYHLVEAYRTGTASPYLTPGCSCWTSSITTLTGVGGSTTGCRTADSWIGSRPIGRSPQRWKRHH